MATTPNITQTIDHERFFHGDMFILFSVFFVMVCIIHWPFITMPPVWDTAAGVFAPAIYLYENNGDFLQLIQQTGYVDGGPNVHSINAITMLTYAAIYISNGNTAIYLPLLHVIHFIFAALVLTATFGLTRSLLGKTQAWAVSICVLFTPVFLVQTGYLYTEVLGAALALLSILAWSTRHYKRMALFAITACLVKSFGVVLVFAFAFLLLIDSTLKLGKRIMIAASMMFATIAIELTKWVAAATPAPGLNKIIYQKHLDSIISNLNQVPDLRFLVFVSLMFCFGFILHKKLWRPRLFFSHITELLEGNKKGRAWLAAVLIPVALIGFIATVPLVTGRSFFPLPRYYVWSLPLMLIIFGATVTVTGAWLERNKFIGESISQQLFFLALFSTLLFYLAANHKGATYPGSNRGINRFSIAERSLEYLNFFDIQLAGAKSVEKHAAGRPVFVTRGAYYFLSSPLMGYITRPVNDLRFILTEPYPSHNFKDFPDEFFLLDSNSNKYHGQRIIRNMILQPRWLNNYEVETLEHYSSGRYQTKLFRIYRVLNVQQ